MSDERGPCELKPRQTPTRSASAPGSVAKLSVPVYSSDPDRARARSAAHGACTRARVEFFLRIRPLKTRSARKARHFRTFSCSSLSLDGLRARGGKMPVAKVVAEDVWGSAQLATQQKVPFSGENRPKNGSSSLKRLGAWR